MTLFELEWLGGPAEHHFRRARPGIDELPWGTIDLARYPAPVAEEARATWTQSAYAEYKAVAAFSAVLAALCEAQAPLDLIGMASGFVADEVVHVELASRVAMELGGGVKIEVDFDALFDKPDPGLTAFQRANDLVLRVSCIAEAFSGRMVVGAARATTHPLTRAVLQRIAADESLHYRLGGVYFEWAKDLLDDDERARLGEVAMRTLKDLSTQWRRTRANTPLRPASKTHVHELGWMEAPVYREGVCRAVRESIVKPLESYGIRVPKDEVNALLSPGVFGRSAESTISQ